MNNPLNSKLISVLKNTAKNLNIDDIKQGSYLNTLIRGLYQLNLDTEQKVNQRVNNINIDTADEDTLESFGAKKSLPRIKHKSVSIPKESRGVSLKIDTFRGEIPIDIIFEKGESVFSDTLKVTFLEDIYASTDSFISCDIINEDRGIINTRTLEIGDKIDLPVPSNLKDYVNSIQIEANSVITLSNFEEDLEVYRSRLRHFINSENISNKNSIELLLNRVPYVSQHYIDTSSNPYTIYLMNDEMYFDKNINDFIKSHSIPFARDALDKYRSYNTLFEFQVARRLSYTLDIKYSGEYTLQDFEGLEFFINLEHRLDKDFLISRQTIERYLSEKNMEGSLEVLFSFYFNGVKFSEGDGQEMFISKREYPFLEELSINGEVINV